MGMIYSSEATVVECFQSDYCLPSCATSPTQEKGMLQRMEQYKPTFQEPKRKGDFNPVIT